MNGGSKMKTSSTGFLMLSITWLIVSLIWFFWVKNIAIGVIWLCAGIIELIIALVSRKNTKKK